MLAGPLVRAGVCGGFVEHVANLVEDGTSVLSRGLRTVVRYMFLHVVVVVVVVVFVGI